MEHKQFSRKFKNHKSRYAHHPRKTTSEKDVIKLLEEKKSKLSELSPDDIKSFEDFPISGFTLKGLTEEKFLKPTKVQRQSLFHSLSGVDVVAAAKTGSGKTLAFIIPLLEHLYCKLWSQIDGLGALVITPTRELAYQILEVINKVGKHHNFSVGLIIGGKDLKFEWSRMGSCNIMICTPGRLLQHMTENPNFSSDNLQLLILDEADQCLSMGFADTMNIILEELPSDRQTLLFSATQTRDVKDLIRAGCKEPIFCSAHEYSKTTTPKTLKESYVICEDSEKLVFLWSFLRHHLKHKILLFLSTCKQVKYMFDIFCKLQPGLSVMGLHGDMHQLRRMAVYDEFCRKKHAVLFATDVAARGLDIPMVDWVVQVDCPEDVTTYIHRAGRTARHVHNGEALLLLTSSQESSMVPNLHARNIPIEKIDVDPNKMQSVDRKIAVILTKYVNLREEAVRAFKAYLKYFSLMKDKKVFQITSIDLDAYARSLGLLHTPRVRFLERKLKNIKKEDSKETDTHRRHLPDTEETKGPTSEDEVEDIVFKGCKKRLPDSSLPDHVLTAMQDKLQNEAIRKSKDSLTNIILKKGLKINTKVVFDDDDDDTSDVRTSDHEEEVPKEALDDVNETEQSSFITRMKDRLVEQDHLDKAQYKLKVKEKHKKEKLKEKRAKQSVDEEERDPDDVDHDDSEEEEEEFDTETQTFIDELPDPDQVYGHGRGRGRSTRDEQESSSSADEDSEGSSGRLSASGSVVDEVEEETVSVKDLKRKKPSRTNATKRPRMEDSEDLSSLPVGDKEALALFLLQGKR